MGCAISPAPDSFASGLLGYLDCQAATLGSQGFAALAMSSSSVSLLLGTLLTIFIALFGYRMLFGETPGAREAVLGIVKIGIVLAFATSWSAYRTVVFDVVLRAPTDLASEIGRPAGLPGAAGGLAMRMDGVDRSFRILAIYGVGTPTRDQVEQANGVAPPLFANFDTFALGASRVMFLVGSLGAFALLRLGAGLLLALGPLFIAFLLFETTRGLTQGWLRGLAAVTFGSTGVAIALGSELALLEPWISDLAAQRAGGIAIPGVPVTILAATTIFALAIAGLLALIVRIAFGLTFPDTTRWVGDVSRQMDMDKAQAGKRVPFRTSNDLQEPRSRAVVIANSIAASQRRDEHLTSSGGISRAQTISGSVMTAPGHSMREVGSTPLGQSIRRRNSRRVSASAKARDRAS